MNIQKRGWFTHLTGFYSVFITALTLGTAGSAFANPPNQSDVTGTNVFNNVAPGFLGDYGEFLDPATLAEAERLSQDLDEAYRLCQASAEAAEDQPRRFALGDADETPCTSAACVAYGELLSETEQFIADVEAAATELEQLYRERLW